jgi:hypothetical protein
MSIRMIICLYILVLVTFIIFYFLINFKWCVKTLREISHPKNQGGYIKLIQMGIVSMLIIIFGVILIY